jgi:exosortase A-associated hydrolase 2
LLYVHPFAEELNKSRRMVALQSRALAEAGFHVLQVDLFGCGDSSGDLADARWSIWKRDLTQALQWLSDRVDGPYALWGLRLGALLALDLASDAPLPLRRLIMWQPILKGKTCVDQFLRLEMAGRMLTAGKQAPPGPQATAMTARQQLAAGVPVEVAGYLLTPELARDIDGIDAASLLPSAALSWFEIASGGELSAAASAHAGHWRAAGVSLSLQAVAGPAFWSSGEIATCPELLTETTLAATGELSKTTVAANAHVKDAMPAESAQ